MPSGIYKRKKLPFKKRKPLSEETKKKISESLKGKIVSKETRIKQSNSHIGIPQPWKLGSNNPSWKGGISSENHKIRHSLEYKKWRRECLLRDNFTCQISGQYGGKLEVHHINNFADFPELRFDINNGIVISKEIHDKFHSIYGIKNNTREQLEEFIKEYAI